MTDRERVYKLVNKVCEYGTWALELKQENSELKNRVAELEKPKKKHKFRAMTNLEFCRKWWKSHLYCKSDDIYCCPQFMSKICYKANQNKPCKINGKYIMVEVKE